MTLTLELPNDLSEHENPAQEALEAIAVEAYQSGSMSRHEAAKLLSVGRLGFSEVLTRRGVPATTYGVEDLRADIATGDRLRAEGKLPR